MQWRHATATIGLNGAALTACADRLMRMETQTKGQSRLWRIARRARWRPEYSPVPTSTYYAGPGRKHVDHYKFPVLPSCGGDNAAAVAAFKTLFSSRPPGRSTRTASSRAFSRPARPSDVVNRQAGDNHVEAVVFQGQRRHVGACAARRDPLPPRRWRCAGWPRRHCPD